MSTDRDYTDYQTEVGRSQGADRFFGKASGVMDLDGAFQFFVNGSTNPLTALELQQAVGIRQVSQKIGQGATSTAFSVTNYPGATRYIMLSMTSTCVDASFALVSGVKAGEEVHIMLYQGSTASGLVTILFSGCSYVGLKGSTLDSITMYNSIASTAFIHLVSHTDDEWTIAAFKGNVAE